MTIDKLIRQLVELSDTLPDGLDSQVVAWVRVPNAGDSAVLEVTQIQQGYRITHGGPIATLCLDSRA
jgi:hypothetical protein